MLVVQALGEGDDTGGAGATTGTGEGCGAERTVGVGLGAGRRLDRCSASRSASSARLLARRRCAPARRARSRRCGPASVAICSSASAPAWSRADARAASSCWRRAASCSRSACRAASWLRLSPSWPSSSRTRASSWPARCSASATRRLELGVAGPRARPSAGLGLLRPGPGPPGSAPRARRCGARAGRPCPGARRCGPRCRRCLPSNSPRRAVSSLRVPSSSETLVVSSLRVPSSSETRAASVAFLERSSSRSRSGGVRLAWRATTGAMPLPSRQVLRSPRRSSDSLVIRRISATMSSRKSSTSRSSYPRRNWVWVNVLLRTSSGVRAMFNSCGWPTGHGHRPA